MTHYEEQGRESLLAHALLEAVRMVVESEEEEEHKSVGSEQELQPEESEQEEESEEEEEELRAPSPPPKKKPPSSKASVPGGPCAHCGATESPQWRRPLTKKVVLCNACGIYYSRHHSLPKRKKVPVEPKPLPPPDRHVYSELPPAGPIHGLPPPSTPPAAVVPQSVQHRPRFLSGAALQQGSYGGAAPGMDAAAAAAAGQATAAGAAGAAAAGVAGPGQGSQSPAASLPHAAAGGPSHSATPQPQLPPLATAYLHHSGQQLQMQHLSMGPATQQLHAAHMMRGSAPAQASAAASPQGSSSPPRHGGRDSDNSPVASTTGLGAAGAVAAGGAAPGSSTATPGEHEVMGLPPLSSTFSGAVAGGLHGQGHASGPLQPQASYIAPATARKRRADTVTTGAAPPTLPSSWSGPADPGSAPTAPRTPTYCLNTHTVSYDSWAQQQQQQQASMASSHTHGPSAPMYVHHTHGPGGVPVPVAWEVPTVAQQLQQAAAAAKRLQQQQAAAAAAAAAGGSGGSTGGAATGAGSACAQPFTPNLRPTITTAMIEASPQQQARQQPSNSLPAQPSAEVTTGGGGGAGGEHTGLWSSSSGTALQTRPSLSADQQQGGPSLSGSSAAAAAAAAAAATAQASQARAPQQQAQQQQQPQMLVAWGHGSGVAGLAAALQQHQAAQQQLQQQLQQQHLQQQQQQHHGVPPAPSTPCNLPPQPGGSMSQAAAGPAVRVLPLTSVGPLLLASGVAAFPGAPLLPPLRTVHGPPGASAGAGPPVLPALQVQTSEQTADSESVGPHQGQAGGSGGPGQQSVLIPVYACRGPRAAGGSTSRAASATPTPGSPRACASNC